MHKRNAYAQDMGEKEKKISTRKSARFNNNTS